MNIFVSILIVCFFGHISESANAKEGEWLTFESRPVDENGPVPRAVPLLPQRRPTPRIGETFHLSCGYDRSQINIDDIKSLKWYTSKNGLREEISENPYQKLSAKLYDGPYEYKEVLTVRNVDSSDNGRSFDCWAFTEIEGIGLWQHLKVELELSDGLDTVPYPAPLEERRPTTTTTTERARWWDDLHVRIDVEPLNSVAGSLPMFPHGEPTPRLGDTLQFTCGYDLSVVDFNDIILLNWYSFKPNEDRTGFEVLEQELRGLSVRTYRTSSQYTKVLTVRNVNKEHNERRFYCDSATAIGNHNSVQRLHHVDLRVFGSEDQDQPKPIALIHPTFQPRELLRITTFAADPNLGIINAVPLLDEYKPIPRLGEPIQLTCGYDLRTINRHSIKSIKWSTYKDHVDQETSEIPEDSRQRIFVSTNQDGYEYSKVLTIRNVITSDFGREFYCFALAENSGVKFWQYLHVKLEVSDTVSNPNPALLERPVTPAPSKRPADQRQELIKVITVPEGLETHTVPLLPQYKPTPRLGDTFQLSCGYDASKIDIKTIDLLNWYTFKHDNDAGTLTISEDPTQRFSVRLVNDGYDYKKILTVRDVEESDHGRIFFCLSNTDVHYKNIWQRLSVQLKVLGVE